MAKIAAEMNLPITSFVTLLKSGEINDQDESSFEKSSKFGIRWFTPQCEDPICGHGTLAAAAIIFDKYANKSKTIEFKASNGIVLRASRAENSSITLDLPLNEPSSPLNKDENLQQLVRFTVGDAEIEDIKLCASPKILLIRLADKYSRKDLEALIPSTQEMLSIKKDITLNLIGVIVTLRANLESEGYDFYSRYFAPWVGIAEDSVTGSTHTVLAPFWQSVYGKSEFKARQCSKRGGDLGVGINNGRVELTCKVAHVLEGSMRIQ